MGKKEKVGVTLGDEVRKSRRVRKLAPLPPPHSEGGGEVISAGERERKRGRRQDPEEPDPREEEQVSREDGDHVKVNRRSSRHPHPLRVLKGRARQWNKVGGASPSTRNNMIVTMMDGESGPPKKPPLRQPHRSRFRSYDARPTFMTWIFLIATCSASVVGQQQQQTFRVRPKPVEVKLGGQAVLRCEVDNQAGPAQWTKDGFALGFQHEIPGYPRYSMVGDSSGGVHNLKIQNVTLQDMAEYQCQVLPKGPVRAIRSEDVVLTVLFNLKEVKIGGPTEAAPGDSVTLTCTTSNSKPKAEIAWFKGGESVEALHTYWLPSEDGGWTTSSNVSIPVFDTDREIIVTCQGVNNGLGESKLASHTISVIQPPGRPRISKTSLNMTAGHSQLVTCTSTGGHPPPSLQWVRGSEKVESRLETKGNTVTAELTLKASPNDNGEVYRCKAKNKAISKAYSESISFHVLFPPTHVNITVNPQVLKEGQRANLTCESASSNPPARMSWWKDGVPIPSHSNYTLPGDNRGKRAVSLSILDLTAELDNAVYTCSANNFAVRKYAHDAITLQVAYKPKFIENPGEKVTVVEGKSARISVKAKGNPDQVTYQWSKNGAPVLTTERKVAVDGPELSFMDVSRKDKGKYEIGATNKEGTSTLSVQLDVQYPATIDTPFPVIMIGQGELATMECLVDANPLEEWMLQWGHESGEKTSQLGDRAEKGFQDGKSYLKIKKVTAADAGLYYCAVNTGIGEATNRSILLIVKHKPGIVISPQTAEAASNKGGTGKLICRAKGAPNVTFSWSREGRSITNATEPAKYSMQYQQVDLMTWESILVVKDVQSRDYGAYECVARNELGDGRHHTVHLDVTSHPEPPVLVKIIVISASIIGTLLLLLSIVVVSYLIYKKKGNGKGMQDGGSEQGNSRPGTIELDLYSGHPMHHEDDGYADALRRSGPTSRHPQVPPIPEYNILPEAGYVPCPPPYGFGGSPVKNGSVLLPLSHPASHTMLNHFSLGGHQSFQPNGSLITASSGPLSPGRLSFFPTFAPNPSPNIMEHEGLLV